MSVPYKRMFRRNPTKKDGSGKYHPQLVSLGKPATLATLTVKMKEKSSLTEGDIKSVLTNFVSTMREELFNGHSVNIENFGVFALAATTEGSEKKEDCTASKIKSVRITFRASTNVRPSLTSTRMEDQMDFVSLEKMLEAKESGSGSTETPDDSGGGSDGGGGSDVDNPLG